MQLAPIALFVYNRPEHTLQTLEHLSRCDLVSDSELYIYADGPKADCSQETLGKIINVRQLIANVTWAKKVTVSTRDVNIGLAKSIVTGVTELCEKFGRVIVLEDDLIVSRGFLTYMNTALEKYKDTANVYQISGYMFPLSIKIKEDGFFLPLTTTWGWATWDRAWKIFNWNPVGIHEKLKDKKFKRKFDLGGAYPYSDMLIDRLTGKNDSWGIFFWFAVFNNAGLVLYPKESFVWNIGFDGTGTHCSKSIKDLDNIKKNEKRYFNYLPAEVTFRKNDFNTIKVYFNKLQSKNRRALRKILKLIKDVISWLVRLIKTSA